MKQVTTFCGAAMKQKFAVFLFLVIGFVIILSAQQVLTSRKDNTSKPVKKSVSNTHGTGEILVQYKDNVSESEKARVREEASVLLKTKVDTPLDRNLEVVIPKSQDPVALRNALSKISDNPAVDFAELQVSYKTQKQ